MLADDDRQNRRLIELVLSEQPIDLVCVENGAEAIRMLDAQPFDLVLMDINMPVMAGDVAIQKIRASGTSYANVSIVAFTANAMTGDRENYLNLGANGYITKPLDIHDFVGKVDQFVKATPTEWTPRLAG